MNCIIVDDRSSSKQIETCVSKINSLQLAGIFNDKKSLLESLYNNVTPLNIDLVFADIQLIGFEVLDYLNNYKNPPNVIIITEHDEFALKAFDYGVVDYLLKPITFPRFCRALDKLSRYYTKYDLPIQSKEDIYIRKGTELLKLKVTDIFFIEGLENYIRLYTKNGKFAIHFTMKGVESQLPPEIFKRIHKSYIVNRGMISSIKEDTLEIVSLDQIHNIPIGKTYRDSLIKSLNMI